MDKDKDNTRPIPRLDNMEAVGIRLILVVVMVLRIMDQKEGMEVEGGILLGCE